VVHDTQEVAEHVPRIVTRAQFLTVNSYAGLATFAHVWQPGVAERGAPQLLKSGCGGV